MTWLEVKKFIPNLLTLGNLLCGCFALVLLLGSKDLLESRGGFSELQNFSFSFKAGSRFTLIIIFIFIALFFDFFDGFLARLLGAQSEIGKQLDSLADMVTFGVLPGMMMFWLFRHYGLTAHESEQPFLPTILGALCFIIPLGACFRLAKFNIQEDTSGHFKGLATPAMTLFVIGVFSFFYFPKPKFITGFTPIVAQQILLILCLILSWLMISRLPLFSFKIKNFTWKDNWYRYLLIAISIPLIIWLELAAFTLSIPLYILLSFIAKKELID